MFIFLALHIHKCLQDHLQENYFEISSHVCMLMQNSIPSKGMILWISAVLKKLFQRNPGKEKRFIHFT